MTTEEFYEKCWRQWYGDNYAIVIRDDLGPIIIPSDSGPTVRQLADLEAGYITSEVLPLKGKL